jgi:hypothetical protein
MKKYCTKVVVNLPLETPGCHRLHILEEILHVFAELAQKKTVAFLQFLFVEMFEVLVGGEELSVIFDAQQGLERAVHVASVAEVVEASCRDVVGVFEFVLLIVVAVEGLRTAFEVEGLVVDSTLITAVVHLVADATYN